LRDAADTIYKFYDLKYLSSAVAAPTADRSPSGGELTRLLPRYVEENMSSNTTSA